MIMEIWDFEFGQAEVPARGSGVSVIVVGVGVRWCWRSGRERDEPAVG